MFFSNTQEPIVWAVLARVLQPGMLINALVGESVSCPPSDRCSWMPVTDIIEYDGLLHVQTAFGGAFCYPDTPVVTAVTRGFWV